MAQSAILSVRVIGNANDAIKTLDETGRKASGLSGIASKIGTAFKVGVGTVATGAVAGLGYSLTKGFDRLSGIENAEAKMRGLGYAANDVESIMNTALDSVLGTAFTLDEAATTAASAVAAGIKPGQDLQFTLNTVANAAAAAGTDMASMGSIFTKAATAGKAQNDVLSQVADRGIPIYQALGEVMGTTAEEVFTLASQGKVSFDQFQQAMSNASGAVAAELGGTATGSLRNFNAAVANMGATLLGGFFPHIAPIVQALTTKLKELTTAIGPAATEFGDRFGSSIQRVADWILQLDFSKILNFTQTVDFSTVASTAGSLGESFARLAPSLGTLAQTAGTLAVQGIELLAGAIGFLADHSDKLAPLIPILAAAFVGWRVSSSAMTGSLNALRLAEVAMTPVTTANQLLRRANIRLEMQAAAAMGTSTAATMASTTTQKAATVATKGQTIAQRALNVAMRANPIGIIITVLTALVGAIVYAWNNVDGFKEAVIGAWNWIRDTTKAVWDTVVNIVTTVWDGITNAVTWYIETVQTVVSTAWNWIRDTTSNIWNGIRDFFGGIWDGIVNAVTWYIETVQTVVSTAWNWIRDTTSNIWNGIKDFFGGIWDGITSVVTTAGETVQNIIGGAWNWIRDTTSNIWNGFTDTIGGAIDGAVNFVTGLPGRIIDGLGNIGSLLVDSGKNLIQGFIDGINNMFNGAIDTVGNLVQKVRDFFPFSPAKTGPFSGMGYTTFSGQALMEDFAAGMLNQRRKVAAATRDVMSTAAAIAAETTLETPHLAASIRRAHVNTTTSRQTGRQTQRAPETTININVDGALDPQRTADQIYKLLRQRGHSLGLTVRGAR